MANTIIAARVFVRRERDDQKAQIELYLRSRLRLRLFGGSDGSHWYVWADVPTEADPEVRVSVRVDGPYDTVEGAAEGLLVALDAPEVQPCAVIAFAESWCREHGWRVDRVVT